MQGDFVSVVGSPHLGGYIDGGDDATFYPQLWDWLVDQHGVQTVLDVGCGEGHSTDYFISKGCTALGIDGVPQPRDSIDVHDFTLGPYEKVSGMPPLDLVWCCEVLEHVAEEFVPNLRTALTAGKLALVTHAEPGQAGFHHVNCQPPEYWIGVFAAWGYVFDRHLTEITRLMAGMNRNPWNHYVRSGLAFTRR